MANDNVVVGQLKAVLTADTGNFDAGMKKAATGTQAVEKGITGLNQQVQKLTPQAERMIKAFGGDRLLYQANSIATAINKVGGAQRLTEAEQARQNRTLTEAIAKYRALGVAAPQAILDAERATRRLTPTIGFADKAIGSLRSNFGSMFAAFTAGNLAASAVTGLVGMAKAAVAGAGALVDLSGKTGLSIEGLQRMQFVAEQTGTTIDTFAQAALMLGVNVAKGTTEAKDAVKDLGLSYEQLRAMRPDQQFETIMAALQRVEQEQERNRLAMALFGKTAKDVLPAVADGYSDIAKNAAIASDAQVRALDRYSDRAGQFWRNSITNVTAFIGKQLALTDAVSEVTREFERQGRALDQVQIMAEATRRVELGLLGQRERTDINLSRAGAPARFESYVAQLRKVRDELKTLTAADRAEIAAAQQLGAETEDLATRFKVSETALRLLNAEMKQTSRIAKDTVTQLQQLDTFDAINRYRLEGFRVNMNASLAAQGVRVPDPARLVGIADTIDRTALRNAVSVSPALRGDRSLRVVFDEWQARWEQLQVDMTGSFSDSIGQMLTGLRGFKTSFLDIWQSIRQSLAGILSGIVQNYISGFVGKLLPSIAGGAGAGALLGGGAAAAAGAGVTAASGAATGTAVAGGAAAGGGFGATIAGLATNPFTIAAAGGLALGLAVWKGGLFRGGWEGTEGNRRRDRFLGQFGDPANKGIGGAGHNLAAMLTGFGAGAGGGSLFSALQRADSERELVGAQRAIISFLGEHGKRGVKSFSLGGFVPPGAVQPAILHGGTLGEIVAPVSKLAAAASRQTFVTFQISALDGADITRVLRTEIIPKLKVAMQLNQDDYLGHTKRVLA